MKTNKKDEKLKELVRKAAEDIINLAVETQEFYKEPFADCLHNGMVFFTTDDLKMFKMTIECVRE